MPNIIAIIPARKGSKRIPDKNIKPLNGLPLIEHTILSAYHCNLITHAVVSTNYGIEEVPFAKYKTISYHRRPDHLCTDESLDFDVVKDVLQSKNYGYDWDLIVYLRPTTPYRADYHLCEAIELMLQPDWAGTGLRSVELMSESPYKCYTGKAVIGGIVMLEPVLEHSPEGGNSLRAEGINHTDKPNQEVPQGYKPNGYIDIIRPQMIMNGSLWGNRLIGYETPHTPEIDTPDDWDYAEWFGRRWVDAPLRYGKEEHEIS